MHICLDISSDKATSLKTTAFSKELFSLSISNFKLSISLSFFNNVSLALLRALSEFSFSSDLTFNSFSNPFNSFL